LTADLLIWFPLSPTKTANSGGDFNNITSLLGHRQGVLNVINDDGLKKFISYGLDNKIIIWDSEKFTIIKNI
jgi:hypothetical protein